MRCAEMCFSLFCKLGWNHRCRYCLWINANSFWHHPKIEQTFNFYKFSLCIFAFFSPALSLFPIRSSSHAFIPHCKQISVEQNIEIFHSERQEWNDTETCLLKLNLRHSMSDFSMLLFHSFSRNFRWANQNVFDRNKTHHRIISSSNTSNFMLVKNGPKIIGEIKSSAPCHPWLGSHFNPFVYEAKFIRQRLANSAPSVN